MINKDAKVFCSLFGFFFIFTEITILMFGEGIMFGYRVFDNEIRLFALAGIGACIVSIILIFKDKNIGYLIFALVIAITLLVYFGHLIGWWPCEYCDL